jgi:hypothetical protein
VFLILKVFVVAGLLKLLIETNQPLLCSGLYGGVVFVVDTMVFGFWIAVLLGLLAFALATAYFWLLDRLEGAGALWWLVMIIGMPLALI